jgi:hypothetical protein
MILVQQLKIGRHLPLGENLPFGFLILNFFPRKIVLRFYVGLQQKQCQKDGFPSKSLRT